MITKGRISSVTADGKTAAVVPAFSGGVVSHSLVIPADLRGKLETGTEVVYCAFSDGTGVIICRLDGEA